MAYVVRAILRDYDEINEYIVDDPTIRKGEYILVPYEDKKTVAKVVWNPIEIKEAPPELQKGRRLTEEEQQWLESLKEKEEEALRYCQERSDARNLEMKLRKVKWFFDGSKIIFYFTADGRVDFRELVKKDLAPKYRTRIELRQIGVRDEAKLLGGIGPCGREICCATFLREFKPISVKMVKIQNLPLNPAKVSGVCGRLMCCLAFEYEQYIEARKELPVEGQIVKYHGETMTVTDINVLKRVVYLKTDDDQIIKTTADQLEYEKIFTEDTYQEKSSENMEEQNG